MQPKTRATRFLDRLFEAQLRIACLALVAMMLVIVADVGLRYFLNSPLRGSYDLVQITLVVMVVFGLPRLFVDGLHIAIDLVDHLLPQAGVRLLSRIAALLSAVALCFIFYAMIGPFWSAFQYGDRSLELNLPQWIVWLLALVGIAGAVLAALASLLHQPPVVEHAAVEAFE